MYEKKTELYVIILYKIENTNHSVKVLLYLQ